MREGEKEDWLNRASFREGLLHLSSAGFALILKTEQRREMRHHFEFKDLMAMLLLCSAVRNCGCEEKVKGRLYLAFPSLLIFPDNVKPNFRTRRLLLLFSLANSY